MRFLLLTPLILFGCTVDLGECNEPASRRVVYDASGAPAYEGQALLATSCGNASFCHSSGATSANRFGATTGLDFDLYVATTGEGAAETETERLRRAQANVVEWSDDIFCEVDEKRMPPFGESTLVAHADTPRFRDEAGERLPFVDSFEGIDILRNWLACGAPVVERTTPRPDGVTPVGDIVPRLGE